MSHLYAGSEDGGLLLSPRASISLRIEDSSQVGEARRVADSLAHTLGFGDTAQGNLGIVVTEIANNLVRHAGGGEILIRAVETDGVCGIEILSLDKGPGMADVPQCLEDGFSTFGTSGTGLGAIRRLSASLDIYSVPGSGTALVCYVWKQPVASGYRVGVGAVNRPKPGQEACGDHWTMASVHGRHVYMIADGLGHGPEAAQAGQAAVRAFGQDFHKRPSMILEAVHSALHGTRGAAVAVADVDEATQTVCFAGVGNIAGEIMSDANSGMMSHHGIVGFQMRKVQEFTYPYADDSLLLMSSDGIASLGSLAAYPTLLTLPPALIAGVLYRDFQRTNDDSTILIARMQAGKGGPP